MRKNGFLEAFKIAQRNLAQNGNPTQGESLGNLTALFNLAPPSQYILIRQGQAAALANFLDTTTAITGRRGGLVTRAGLPETFFRFNPQVLNLSKPFDDGTSITTLTPEQSEQQRLGHRYRCRAREQAVVCEARRLLTRAVLFLSPIFLSQAAAGRKIGGQENHPRLSQRGRRGMYATIVALLT